MIGAYHSWPATKAALDEISSRSPSTIRVMSIGLSAESRDIPAIVVRTARHPTTKILVVGCHHAREWISVEVPLGFAERLGRKLEPEEHQLVEGIEFTIVPMLNPDGHIHSSGDGNRLWRKNRREVDEEGRVGVDLNRNYSVSWSVGMSDSFPLSDMYCGPSAFSEPETIAIRDLVRRNPPDLAISYHCFGEEVLYPWGHQPNPGSPPASLRACKRLAEAYSSGTGRLGAPYVARQLRDHYGVGVGGEMIDWVVTETKGACLGLTVELSPAGDVPGFLLPPSEIPRVIEQNWAGLLELLCQFRVLGTQSKQEC